MHGPAKAVYLALATIAENQSMPLRD